MSASASDVLDPAQRARSRTRRRSDAACFCLLFLNEGPPEASMGLNTCRLRRVWPEPCRHTVASVTPRPRLREDTSIRTEEKARVVSPRETTASGKGCDELAYAGAFRLERGASFAPSPRFSLLRRVGCRRFDGHPSRSSKSGPLALTGSIGRPSRLGHSGRDHGPGH